MGRSIWRSDCVDGFLPAEEETETHAMGDMACVVGRWVVQLWAQGMRNHGVGDSGFSPVASAVGAAGWAATVCRRATVTFLNRGKGCVPVKCQMTFGGRESAYSSPMAIWVGLL